MKLYLVRGNDVDGENQDLFAVASTPDRAVELWNAHCIEEGWNRVEDEWQRPSTSASPVKPANVREILASVAGTKFDGAERVVAWSELAIVG